MTSQHQNRAETPNNASGEQALWQLIISEDRLHSERTSFFLIANAFLLTAFAILRENAELGIQFIPVFVGMVFSLFHFVNIRYGEKMMELWQTMVKSEDPAGGYILSERDALIERTWWLKHPLGRLTRTIQSYAFPCLFFMMWLALVVLELIIL